MQQKHWPDSYVILFLVAQNFASQEVNTLEYSYVKQKTPSIVFFCIVRCCRLHTIDRDVSLLWLVMDKVLQLDLQSTQPGRGGVVANKGADRGHQQEERQPRQHPWKHHQISFTRPVLFSSSSTGEMWDRPTLAAAVEYLHLTFPGNVCQKNTYALHILLLYSKDARLKRIIVRFF